MILATGSGMKMDSHIVGTVEGIQSIDLRSLLDQVTNTAEPINVMVGIMRKDDQICYEFLTLMVPLVPSLKWYLGRLRHQTTVTALVEMTFHHEPEMPGRELLLVANDLRNTDVPICLRTQCQRYMS